MVGAVVVGVAGGVAEVVRGIPVLHLLLNPGELSGWRGQGSGGWQERQMPSLPPSPGPPWLRLFQQTALPPHGTSLACHRER